MKKVIQSMLLAALLAVPQLKLLADGQATTVAGPVVEAPKWFNGNWRAVARYGDPGDVAGKQAAQEVKAQQAAYKAAKDAGKVEEMVANALWTSVQAWALNNAAFNILIHDAQPIAPNDPETMVAKGLLLRAQNLLKDAEASTYPGEVAQREAASAKIESNLLYAQRLLGEKPWPAKE